MKTAELGPPRGCYLIELEVVLTPEQTVADGEAIADDLTRRLAIQPSQLVRRAYVDLLADLASSSPDDRSSG